MSEIDYQELVAQVPDEWFDQDELKKMISTVFTKLVDAISKQMETKIETEDDLEGFYKKISMKSGDPVEKVEENFVSDSSVFGRINLFDEKYPKIVSQLPKNKGGHTIYPVPVLAKILNVNSDLAEEMYKYYFENMEDLDDSVVN